jgi:hypothetical protein
MVTRRRILVIVLTLLIVATFGWLFRWQYRRLKLEGGYSEVQIGDSRARVIELMGEPNETIPCHQPQSHKTSDNCAQKLIYVSLFQQWIFFLDPAGKVLYRAHNEGSF